MQLQYRFTERMQEFSVIHAVIQQKHEIANARQGIIDDISKFTEKKQLDVLLVLLVKEISNVEHTKL